MADDYDLDNSSLESKWAHLLKPIRDLTDNFSIDIAHELAEYLEQLEHTNFAIEGAGPPVDFAEAALLIQGSACIYSKKVEHLYNLVYQALDAVRHKRKAAGNEAGGGEDCGTQPTGRGRSRAAAPEEPEDSNNLEACFWDVETHLKPGEDIDLVSSSDSGGDGDDSAAWLSSRTPAMLQSLEDFSDAGGAGTTSSSCFLQQCAVHCSGALLLDPRDAHRYDAQLCRIQPHHTTQRPTQRATEPSPMPAPSEPQQDAAMPMCIDQDDGDDGNEGGGADGWLGGGHQDMGGDGGGGGASLDDAEAEGAQPTEAVGATAGAGEQLLSPSRLPGGVLREARAPGTGHAQPGIGEEEQMVGEGEDGGAAEEGIPDYHDPYEPLDHHAKGDLIIKPLLSKKPTKAMLARRVAALPASNSSSNSCSRMARLIGWLPGAAASLASTGLGSREFAYGLALLGIPAQSAAGLSSSRRELAKDRAAAAGRSKKGVVGMADVALFDREDTTAAAGSSSVLKEGGAGGLSHFAVNAQLDRDAIAALALASGLDLPANIDGAGRGDHPEGNNAYADGEGGYYDGGGGADSDDGDHGPGLDVDALEGAVRAGAGDAARLQQLQEQPDGGSYEELCRAHMDAMMAAAAAQQVQSDLAQRVNGWRSKIGPVLNDEETRPGFDIQEVGEAMLTRLGGLKLDDSLAGESLPAAGGSSISLPTDNAPWVTFGAVAVRPRSWEVSRSFAALLQLINNRNVAIHKQGSAPDHPFQLQLLDACMAHHIMGDKIAATARPLPDSMPSQHDPRAANAHGSSAPEDADGAATTSSQRPAAAAQRKAVKGGKKPTAAAGRVGAGKKAKQGAKEDSDAESEGGESEAESEVEDQGNDDSGVENEVVVAVKGGRGKGKGASQETGKHKSKRPRQALGDAGP